MREKKSIKGKEKNGELKLPFCQSLAMLPICAQKQPKKKNKNSSPPFVETWRQHH
jgi:hypothetical protein